MFVIDMILYQRIIILSLTNESQFARRATWKRTESAAKHVKAGVGDALEFFQEKWILMIL